MTSQHDPPTLTAAQLDLIEHSILRNPYIPASITPTIKQAQLLTATEDEVLYGGAVGGGKALDCDTPIPTPTGWTSMGDIAPGDQVFDERGRVCNVTATSGTMHHRPCYRVEFSDGSSIVADAEHRWFTATIAERSAIANRTPEARAARRASRASRGVGKRPDLAAMNAQRAASATLAPPPSGSVRTTVEIAETLHVGGNRVNHSIEVAGPIDLPASNLPIDPYTLGIWLGDGTSSSGSITTADAEIVEHLERAGYQPRKQSGPYGWGTRGLYRPLRMLGLLGNKHIPTQYLRASIDQRLALLQGIVDSDGHIDARGHVEVTWTKRVLVDGLLELLHSLGIKAAARESRATIDGRDCGARWRVKFLTEMPASRLPRKLNRQKRSGFRGTHSMRYIVSVEPVPSRPVQCIAVDSPSRLFLAGREMIPTHNSEALLMAACQFKHLPGSNTLIVRESRDSLTEAGALIPRSHEYLGKTDASWNGTTFTWTFPSGSTIRFGYLRDVSLKRYLSAEYTDVMFEEVTDVTMAAYAALASRARRRAGNPLPVRVIGTCNPPESREGEWLRHRFIRHLDAQGVASSDRFHVEEEGVTTTRRFISASGADNPHLDREAYRRTLAMADRLTRARMLGSWTQAREGKMLDDGDLEIVAGPQHGPHVVRGRFWDLAASKPTSKYPDPDFTVGVLMSIDTQLGTIRVEDVIYMRDTAGKVKRAMLEAAQRDGLDVMIRWWRDPAQAGKSQSADLARMLARWDAQGVQARTNKVANFSPLAAAAANERVSVVDAEWTADYIGSLLSFPMRGVHDDDVDASSLGYHTLIGLDETRESQSGSNMPAEDENEEYDRDLRRMRGLPPADEW